MDHGFAWSPMAPRLVWPKNLGQLLGSSPTGCQLAVRPTQASAAVRLANPWPRLDPGGNPHRLPCRGGGSAQIQPKLAWWLPSHRQMHSGRAGLKPEMCHSP